MTDDLRDRIANTLYQELSIELPAAIRGADAVIAAMEEHKQRERCGGCRDLGAHSPRCPTQPGALWRRLADMAESLGDQIGGNDTTLANRAYDLMVSLRVRGGL